MVEFPSSRISLKDLLSQSLHAVYEPAKVFSYLPEESPNYKTVLPFLGGVGVAWIHLHSFFLFTDPIWSDASRWLLYSALFSTFPIGAWLGFSLMMYRIFQWRERKPSLPRIENGIFNLVMVWALLPLFDAPHLIVDVPLIAIPLFGAHPLHLSLIVAAIFIPLELYYFFSRTCGMAFHAAMILSLAALPIVKFFLEDIGFLAEKGFYEAGLIGGKYDDSVFGFMTAAPLLILLVIWRGFAVGWNGRKIAASAFAVGAFLLSIAALALPHVTPIFPGYASDSGYLDSSRDNKPRAKDFSFPDVISFDFDPSGEGMGELRCIVRFLPQTHRSGHTEGKPRARCDVAAGPDRREGEYILRGEGWSDLDGASERETVWRDQALLRRLTKKNNDIRVHVETGPGDVVSFSGVWIEFVQ